MVYLFIFQMYLEIDVSDVHTAHGAVVNNRCRGKSSDMVCTNKFQFIITYVEAFTYI